MRKALLKMDNIFDRMNETIEHRIKYTERYIEEDMYWIYEDIEELSELIDAYSQDVVSFFKMMGIDELMERSFKQIHAGVI